MPKTYILDTNVLLHNPDALLAFADNLVIVPFAVIEEIDNQKRRQDEIGRNARLVSRRLDEMRVLGHLSEGIALPNGGTLRVELNHQELADCPPGLDPGKYDNRILTLAQGLRRESAQAVIIVTKDLNLRIKADVLGLAAEDFYSDKVDYHELYKGVGELFLASEELNTFYQENGLPWNGPTALYPNEFVVLKSLDNPSQSALCRHIGRHLHPLRHEQAVTWGVKPRNKEQKFAMELLLDDSIQVVTLVGRAGTGKTLLALAAGMEKVLEQNAYSRFLVTRPVIPMGDDLGFLPGTKEEKLRPWMQPIYDNLEYLFRDADDPSDLIDDLLHRGTLELEALTYIRGRSIPSQFILCDEAQNLSPNMIKALVTRVGEGTKIVFTGDPEQIDHPYLDASSNGLTYLVEKLKGENLAGHVTLFQGERSRVAEMGASLL
ncbi:MAG: PhoH family protein [Thermodesulfobacteriota bacterium]|nr:PhoH family protein [Thermodesulfobacteriota bacterium]